MSFYRKSGLMVAAILLAFSLGACGKKEGEGPAERAGKEVEKPWKPARRWTKPRIL